MTTARSPIATDKVAEVIVPWTSRSIEALWLLMVVLVPLVFFRPENFLSEAVIAYVEVPKIALLRTVVGLMAVLWLVEWGLQGKLPLLSRMRGPILKLEPRAWYALLAGWVRAQPTRWVVLAAWFFLGTTIISTLLSASFSVSLWGEVPGQDGFSLYTVATYVLLFGVIASHLKTPGQLWRLLGAIVLMGTLVSGYAVFQHYGHDFLGVLEATGGGRARVTSTMGNAVFAGAAMLMPIVVSLMLATITLSKLDTSTGRQPGLRPKAAFLAILSLWALVLVIQFLGIIFTFSRGPWLGTLLALAGFLVLAAIFLRWRIWAWAALVLALAAGVTWLVLQGPGAGSILGAGTWAPIVLLLAALFAVVAYFTGPGFLARNVVRISPSLPLTRLVVSLDPRTMRRVVLVSGVAAAGVMTAIIALFLFAGDDGTLGQESSVASTDSRSGLTVQQRFASITGEVSTGTLSQRGLIWQTSWRIVQQLPWFQFESLSLPWLRPIIGYGPDLFRYTFLLESSYADGSYLPLEPDHAHNFFIHQMVEQGVLGLLSSLGLFAAIFLVGGYQLARKRTEYSQVHQLVLMGLLAVMAGRLLEQMVGVARVSDLTIFWTLLAVFAALPVAMRSPGPEAPEGPQQGIHTPRRRELRRSRSRAPAQDYDWQRFVRLALVAWAVGGIIALTWVKTINYPRAGLAAAEAVHHFQRGDFQGAVAGFDRAIGLAPDVSVYYNFKSRVLAAYLQNPQVPPDPECSFGRDGTSYDICLGQKIYLSNLAAVQQRPLYWRSRLALADSALALGRHEEAIRLYREVVALVPASWPLYNRLAEAYIDVGQPGNALEVLEESLAITRTSSNSNKAHELQALAREKLSELDSSILPAH